MLARFFIGLGEAAYGSVGLAVVLMVFSPTKRASLTGAFMAGGSFGSVLGVFLGGILAVQLGWRWSFGVMAILGLVLVALYALFVNDAKLARNQHPGNAGRRAGHRHRVQRAKLRTLVSTPAVICAYVGSGLQLFVAGVAVRLAAQLPQPRLRPRPGQGRRRRRRLHPAHGRRHDRVRHHHRPAQPDPRRSASGPTALVYAALSLVAAAAGLRPGPGHAAAGPDRGRRVLRRRHHRPRRRHGRQPDPRLDPRHRLRHARPWPTTCSAWPPARSWSALLADRIGLVDAMKFVPAGLGPRHRRAAHRAPGLPEQHPPRRRRRVGLITPHRKETRHDASGTTPPPSSCRASAGTSRTTGRPGSPPGCPTPSSFPRSTGTSATWPVGWPTCTRSSRTPTRPVTIVAHSAGVLTTVHWARQHDLPVRGALLATPPDLARPLPPEYPSLERARGSRLAAHPAQPAAVPQHRRGQHQRRRSATSTTCRALAERLGQPVHRHRTGRPPQPRLRVRRVARSRGPARRPQRHAARAERSRRPAVTPA